MSGKHGRDEAPPLKDEVLNIINRGLPPIGCPLCGELLCIAVADTEKDRGHVVLFCDCDDWKFLEQEVQLEMLNET